MWSSERGAFSFEKQHPRQDRILNLGVEFIEFRFELDGKENDPRNSILISWKLYGSEELL